MKVSRFAVFVLIAAAVPAALATDYFVRTDGRDTNAGTANTAAGAFLTVGKCATTAKAGDRCRIQPGLYREKGITQANAGVLDGTAVATCSCTAGSTTVSCTGAVPASVSAGKFVQCQAGYGFSWTKVASVSGSTITLAEGYRGKTASGNALDVARFVEIVGEGASPTDVAITTWYPKPSGLTWTKETGTSCVWSYTKSSTTDAVWNRSIPRGFRENYKAKWDLYRLNQNGADPLMVIGSSSTDADGDGGMDVCPCGEGKTAVQHVDILKGSYSHDSTKVYLHPRHRCSGGTADGFNCLSNADCPGGGTCGGCPDPNTLQIEAGDSNPGGDTLFTARKDYTVVRNMAFEGSNRHKTGEAKNVTYSALIGGSNALYSDLRILTGVWGFQPVAAAGGPSVDTLYERLKTFDGAQCLLVAGSYSGLKFYDVEVRGNFGNVMSCDEMRGTSPEDRIILDRLYLHRDFTGYIGNVDGGNTCNGNSATFDCATGTWVGDMGYRGNHAMYIGSTTSSKNIDFVVVQNSITELATDGLSFFHGNNSKDVWYLNNTFGTTEHAHRLAAKFGNMTGGNTGGIKAYNNLFIQTYGSALSQGSIDRESGVSPSNITSDYNIFLDANVDANGGSSTPASMRVWESGETLSSVINSYNQERNSIQVCKQGCQGASPGNHVDANGAFRLADVTVKDGTPTDYTPVTGFWGIDAGNNAWCPPHDFKGNPRTDGRCDIGAIEFGAGGSPDVTPPAAVTNFTATAGDRQNTLGWNHSSSSDSRGTVVRFGTGSYPATRTDGTLVCDKLGSPGAADSCVHASLTNGQVYYYSAFSYDGADNAGAAANASATPQGPVNQRPEDVDGLHRTDVK